MKITKKQWIVGGAVAIVLAGGGAGVAVNNQAQAQAEKTAQEAKTAHDNLIKEAKKATEKAETFKAEVASQDRRAEIPEKVRVQFEGEKETMLYQKEQELLEELSSNIKAEEERHKAALAAIKQENEAKRKSTAQSIQDTYAEKITLEVTKRFNKETQHLSNILEGKKSTLAMRQTELTQGLESSFKETLSEVNRNQDKVLKDLSTLQQADNIIALQKQNVG